MIAYTDVTGLAGISFALAALLAPIAAPHAKGRAAWPYVVACIALALIPFDGPSVSVYLRGAFGDLSIATLVLLALRLTGGTTGQDRKQMLLLLALGGVLFYPAALGLGLFDPYRLGFGHLGFVAALLLFAWFGWYRKLNLIALWLALSSLAWAVGCYESTNLWNYLIDPWVVLYSIGALAKLGLASLRKRLSHSVA